MRLLHHSDSGLTPLVTVAIPNFNYARYIKECLESVRAQTFTKIGLVIVDDVSTDNSVEEILSWVREHSGRFLSVKFLQNDVNSGVAATRNAAFHEAFSPYVFSLDPDNNLYPPCVERHYEAIENSQSAFAYAYIEEFPQDDWKYGGLMGVGTWEPRRLVHGNWIDNMSLVSRSAWEKYGGYTETKPRGREDYDLWCKFAENNERGVLVPQVLSRYRVHAESIIRQIPQKEQCESGLRAHFRSVYPNLFGTHAS